MSLKNSYYVSSFFWSTLSKVLTAIVGFLSVPLLLGFYGKAEYGILAIATACNGYMQLLDLGMNIGTVRFFSQWRAEGKNELINRVARTNITFYGLIAIVNILGLVGLALWGEGLFSVTHEQFLLLRTCLLIIVLFSVLSWETTTFNQLLIADKQMAFTMQMQCIITVLKGLLVAMVLLFKLPLTTYFFFLTGVLTLLLIPYIIRCRKYNLINSIRPATYWNDFKVVITFSLSLFLLSLFQSTATQSRPILLSMFASNGATAVTDFRIIEVVPQMIIMIGGTFSGMFLPKTSEMVARKDEKAIKEFAYKWTTMTTIVVACLCFPVMLCTNEILTAYVGASYAHLSVWLLIWTITVLIQMHTTPGNALVLAYGKTKLLVQVTSVACVCSMILNVVLCKYFEVGSAIIAYFLYVCTIIGLYYVVFYKKLLHLCRLKLFLCFIKPTLVGSVLCVIVNFVPISIDIFAGLNERIAFLLICGIKSLIWFLPFVLVLKMLKILDLKSLKN